MLLAPPSSGLVLLPPSLEEYPEPDRERDTEEDGMLGGGGDDRAATTSTSHSSNQALEVIDKNTQKTPRAGIDPRTSRIQNRSPGRARYHPIDSSSAQVTSRAGDIWYSLTSETIKITDSVT